MSTKQTNRNDDSHAGHRPAEGDARTGTLPVGEHCPDSPTLAQLAARQCGLSDKGPRDQAHSRHIEGCDQCQEQVRRLADAMREPLDEQDVLERQQDAELTSMLAQGFEAWRRRRVQEGGETAASDTPPAKPAEDAPAKQENTETEINTPGKGRIGKDRILWQRIAAIAVSIVVAAGIGFLAGRGIEEGPPVPSPYPEARIAELQREVADLHTGIDSLHTEFLRFVRLSIDENTLIQAEALRVGDDRNQWRTILIEWSPHALEPETDTMQEWARRIAFRAGVEYFLARRYSLAEQLFGRAYRLGMRTPSLQMALANIGKETGDWEKAESWLTRLVQDTSSSRTERAQAANLLAYCLSNRARSAEGDARTRLLAQAGEAVDLALQLARPEGYAKAYVQKALIAELAGKPEEARNALTEGRQVAERKLADHPDSPRLHFTLAILHARLGEIDDAVNHLVVAVSLETRDFPVSWWALTESAFAELPAGDRTRLMQAVEEGNGRFATGRDAPLPLTVSGLLWDEDFVGDDFPDETPDETEEVTRPPEGPAT